MDENPELIQAEDWLNPDAVARSTPVFLIHDGGGTTFAYHCLEPLNRPVYGIHNPHFKTGKTFDGGIAEMGKLYSRYILQAISDPDFPAQRKADGVMEILLGGWSLGGHLSLEVARQLAEESRIRVIGILMMDTVYPVRPTHSVTITPPDMSEEGKTANQILSQRAMFEARRMIIGWQAPSWEGVSSRRPPAVLLRAKKAVPVEGEGVGIADVYRGDRNLGWDRYDKDLIQEIIDVEGHHFDLFAFENIEGITAAIRKGLKTLEKTIST